MLSNVPGRWIKSCCMSKISTSFISRDFFFFGLNLKACVLIQKKPGKYKRKSIMTEIFTLFRPECIEELLVLGYFFKLHVCTSLLLLAWGGQKTTVGVSALLHHVAPRGWAPAVNLSCLPEVILPGHSYCVSFSNCWPRQCSIIERNIFFFF